MSGHGFGWRRFAFLAGTGGAVLALTSVLTAALAFGDADDPLWGSETALILGGTAEPTPSPEFARTAEDLYLNQLGFDNGATDSTVCYMDATNPCGAPLQVLTTPELFQQSNSTDASDVVLAVENEFHASPGAFDAEHPLAIFGYSQSATAESIAMTQLHADGIPTDDLHFVFIGDPSAPDGIGLHLESAMDATLGTSLTNELLNTFGLNLTVGSATPDDLYPATIYSLPDDPVANFVNAYASEGLGGALLGIVGPHVEYLGLTPDQVANATTTVDGLLNYVNINDSGINGFDAEISALLLHGVADSGAFQSLFDSLQLLFNNFF